MIRSPLGPLALLTLVLGSACAEPEPEIPPRQVTAVSPFHYPEDLWDAGVEGQTLLRLFVSQGGIADSVLIEETSGYPAFDTAAVRGAADLRFEPAVRGETPVGAWVLLPVQFNLPAAAGDRVPAAGTAADTAADTAAGS